MAHGKITYQNWIVELGFDPDTRSGNGSITLQSFLRGQEDDKSTQAVQQAVRTALDRLAEEEKEFIIRFYFMGETYEDLSSLTGRAPHKLVALHERAVRKLKKMLSVFVKQRYGLAADYRPDCPICRSVHVERINSIINQRDREKSWRPIITHLRESYGLIIRSPQVLIGHEQYHMLETIKP